jgi:hypothetical protein
MISIKLIDDHGCANNFITLVQISRTPNDDALIDSLPHTVVGSFEIGNLIDDLRRVRIQHFCVMLHMPALKAINIINKDYTMNIFDGLTEKLDKSTATELPERLIAPYGDKLPEDGLLQYMAVETIADVIALSGPKAVIVLRDDQKRLLSCIAQYPDLFGFRAVVLSGVPGATYSGEFDSVTWELPRVAYHSVVNDLIEIGRREELAGKEKIDSSIYKTEMNRITRKSGDVKTFEAFDVPMSVVKGSLPSEDSSGVAEDE